MSLVVDASAVVAALVDSGPDGRWADELLETDELAAPHLLPVEVASILRRTSAAGAIAAEVASLAHANLMSLEIELFPYAPLADRVWELRATITPYDAWYVALAEALGAQMATLDRKLTRAPGPACAFVTP